MFVRLINKSCLSAGSLSLAIVLANLYPIFLARTETKRRLKIFIVWLWEWNLAVSHHFNSFLSSELRRWNRRTRKSCHCQPVTCMKIVDLLRSVLRTGKTSKQIPCVKDTVGKELFITSLRTRYSQKQVIWRRNLWSKFARENLENRLTVFYNLCQIKTDSVLHDTQLLTSVTSTRTTFSKFSTWGHCHSGMQSLLLSKNSQVANLWIIFPS